MNIPTYWVVIWHNEEEAKKIIDIQNHYFPLQFFKYNGMKSGFGWKSREVGTLPMSPRCILITSPQKEQMVAGSLIYSTVGSSLKADGATEITIEEFETIMEAIYNPHIINHNYSIF